MILVDVAHAAWRAWEGRTANESAFDRLRGDLATLCDGKPALLIVDLPPYERSAISPDYKANRVDNRDGARAVRGLIEGLKAEGWRCVGVRGHEADDVIASMVAASERAGQRLTVATGDKDLLVLLGRCDVVDMRGEARTEQDVHTRWHVKPAQVSDLLAIMGDASDNVPGAKGLGPKGAASLLATYGTLRSILEAPTPTDADLAALSDAVTRARKLRDRVRAQEGATAAAELATATALAEEAARALTTARLLAQCHASRDAVELSARLVALRDDLPLPEDVLAMIAGTVAAPAPAPAAPAAPIIPMTEEDHMPDDSALALPMPEEDRAAIAPPPMVAAPMIAAATDEPVSPHIDPTDPRWSLALQPQSGRAAYALADRLAASSYFRGKRAEDIAAIILMGRERGVSAMLALQSMHVIDGKVEMSASMIAALVLRSGKAEVFECVETSDDRAVYEAQRKGSRKPLRVSFTREDAQKRGLWGKGNWAKMPDVMLTHRACTKAARLVFPDVVVGLYGDDEIGEMR